MIAPAKNLQVGAASQCRAYAHNQFPRRSLGNGHLLDAHIFASVKDRG
jgi:hypothetical protein